MTLGKLCNLSGQLWHTIVQKYIAHSYNLSDCVWKLALFFKEELFRKSDFLKMPYGLKKTYGLESVPTSTCRDSWIGLVYTLFTRQPCWHFCLIDLILIMSYVMTSLLLHDSCTLWPNHGHCLMTSQYYIWVQREVNEAKMQHGYCVRLYTIY